MRFSSRRSTLFMAVMPYNQKPYFRYILLFGVPLLFLGGSLLRLRLGDVHPGTVESTTQNFFIPCVFHWITDFDCPGCGLTRATLSFLMGSPYWSFYFHPLGPVLGISLICFWLSLLNFRIAQKRDLIVGLIKKHSMSLLLLTLVWGIFRNF